MPRPVIITVAITGSLPRKRDNPGVPVTPGEQIESTCEAYQAGASLVHIHVRADDESPSSDPGRFAEVQAGIRARCPGMIIQFSTGGRGRDARERGSALPLKPDMASLATGSVNFPTSVYENPPQFIDELATRMRDLGIKPEVEVFDLAMLYNARDLLDRGLLIAPVHCQFVLGLRNALPPRLSVLRFLVAELADVMPGATWTAAGIGRFQAQVASWALELGGHVRTGMEDNLRLDGRTLAASNAALVRQAVELCGHYDARPATPAEARALLSLPAQGGAAPL
jgi:uncharacterized protein (DUF849 family)